MEFEWDPRKATANVRKHAVSFAEASTVFNDPLATTVPDPDHSTTEDRRLTIGRSMRDRLLIVAHTDRGNNLRIISARELVRSERQAYEEAT